MTANGQSYKPRHHIPPHQRVSFTTGEVARICGVAPRTVSKWVDQGKIQGYRLPGHGSSGVLDRRIPRAELVRFLRLHGIPHPFDAPPVLLIGASPNLPALLAQYLPDHHFEVARNGFEAGVHAQSRHPDIVVIDLVMGRSEGLAIAANLRRNPVYSEALVIALACEDDADPQALLQLGFNEVFKQPFDAGLLAERIRAATEGDHT